MDYLVFIKVRQIPHDPEMFLPTCNTVQIGNGICCPESIAHVHQ